MTLVDYSENFWGEKHIGYHVLYENLKKGEDCCQELGNFVKERINLEAYRIYGVLRSYSSALASAFGVFSVDVWNLNLDIQFGGFPYLISLEEDLLKFLNKSLIRVNSYISSNNAFVESWRLTKGTLELWCEIQSSCIKNLVDLSKDLIKYHDDLVKSRKRVKEQDVIDAVNLMQTTTTCLQKAKETYSQRCQELLNLKNENASVKDIARIKTKVGKAYEEYKLYVEKYGVVRENFEQKMLKASKAFQAHDTAHLQQMKNFFIHLAKSMDDAHSAVSQVTTDYRQSVERIDIDDIMMKFVEDKGTGRERPELIKWTEQDDLIDIDIISHITGSQSAASSSNSSAVIHYPNENTVPTVNDLLTLDGPWTMPSTAEVKSNRDTDSENEVEAPKNGAAYSYVPKFTSSLGSQKFSQWLPSRRKKYNSQSNLQVSSSDHISDMTTSQSEKADSNAGTAKSFFTKRYKKAKNSMSDLTVTNENKDIFQVDDNRSTASSSRSEDKSHVPVDNASTPIAAQQTQNIFSINDLSYAPPPPLPGTEPPNSDEFMPEKSVTNIVAWPENGADDFFSGLNTMGRRDKNRWSTTSSSDDGDAELQQTTKLRAIQIKPLNESKSNLNASMDELKSAVGTLSLQKSSTFEKDPWSTNPNDLSQMSIKPMRAAFTGDEHLRKKYTNFDSSTLPSGLLFHQSTDPMAGSSIARARPRSHTPTFSSQYAEMPIDGFSTMPRPTTETPRPDTQSFALFDKFESTFTPPSQPQVPSIPEKRKSPSPSPMKNKLPIAMAIQEFVHAWFKPPDLNTPEMKTFGAVLVSFPSSLIAQLTDLKADISSLKFSLQNALNIKAIMPNKKLILPTPLPKCPSSTYKFTVDRLGLANWLLEQQKTSPSNFYNIEIIRYELNESFRPPLYLQSYWKLDPAQTDLRIDYRLNTEENDVKNALLNIVFSTEISGNATLFNSAPTAKWSAENNTLSWTLTEISRHGECSGSLKARLKLTNGHSTPANTMVQFQCVDSSLSKLSVILEDESPYSMSMVKRKIISGKYFCEPEIRQ